MNEKVTKDQERIKNLINMGVSQDLITSLLSQNLSLNQIEDYCNQKQNELHGECIKIIIGKLYEGLKDFNFFPVNDEQTNKNLEIKTKIYKDIASTLLEKDILFSKFPLIFESIVSDIYNILDRVKTNLNKTREDVLAKFLGKELYTDIRISEVDKASKELNSKK